MALKINGVKKAPTTEVKAPVKKTPKTAPKKAKSATSGYTVEELGKAAQEYAEISAQMKIMDERKKALAKIIKDGAVKFGTKDDKGSSYLEVNSYVVGNVSKVSMSLDHEKGADYLEKKGLGDLVDVVTVKTINEDRLEKAVGDNRLTLQEVDSFTNRKVTYSVSVKSMEDMPVVEQSELAMAASKK